MDFWADHGSSLLSELGLEYEMHNTLLAAANDQTQLRQMVVEQNPLDNFTASGEIWPGRRPSTAAVALPRTPSPFPGMVGALTLANDALESQPFALPTMERSHDGYLLPQPIDSIDGMPERRYVHQPTTTIYTNPLSTMGEKRKTPDTLPITAVAPTTTWPETKRRKLGIDDDDGSPDNAADDLEDIDDERTFQNEEERRRYAHIHAEQKRRNNIKQAFLDLKNVLPLYKDRPNVSKAMILKAATDFVAHAVDQRAEIARLRTELEDLRSSSGASIRAAAMAAAAATATRKPSHAHSQYQATAAGGNAAAAQPPAAPVRRADDYYD